MAKLSAKEAKILKALQDKAEAPDDADDFEIRIKNDKGHEISMPFSKGKAYLKKAGFDFDDEPEDDGDDEDGDDGDDEDDEDDPDEDEDEDDTGKRKPGKKAPGKATPQKRGYWAGK